jgi:guanosine-3',5'-bis(diphosphate) 3'-pyrophosphohydrolase
VPVEYQKQPDIIREERWQLFAAQLTGLTPEQTPLLRNAHFRAQSAHEGDNRDSGEPYISHPEAVTLILWNECGLHNPELAAASLLHDTVENSAEFGDTKKKPHHESFKISIDNIEQDFTPGIAKLVGEVTKAKIDGHKVPDKAFAEQEYLERFKTISNRGKLLKMADRLHNLRTLRSKKPHKQQETIDETLEAYLPYFADVEAEYPDEQKLLEARIKDEIKKMMREDIHAMIRKRMVTVFDAADMVTTE